MAETPDAKQTYMLIGLQSKEGERFRAVGPMGACEVVPFDPKREPSSGRTEAVARSGGGTGPDPGDTVIVVTGDFTYATGTGPVITTSEVIAGAGGSSLAVQLLASIGGSTVTRVVIFESSTGEGYVRLITDDPSANVPIPERHYVDVQDGVIGDPALWDGSVPGAKELDDSISEARAAWEI